MASRAQNGQEQGLERLEGEFSAWRRQRSRGTRIPERLWAGAVAAVEVHGVWKTAKRLRLGYSSLKQRCEAQPASAGNAFAGTEDDATMSTSQAEFVELPWEMERGPECLLELEDERGITLRVGLRGAGVQQLKRATRLLWRLSR